MDHLLQDAAPAAATWYEYGVGEQVSTASQADGDPGHLNPDAGPQYSGQYTQNGFEDLDCFSDVYTQMGYLPHGLPYFAQGSSSSEQGQNFVNGSQCHADGEDNCTPILNLPPYHWQPHYEAAQAGVPTNFMHLNHYFGPAEDLVGYPEQLPEEDAVVCSQPSLLHQTPVIPSQKLTDNLKASTTTTAENTAKDSKLKVKAKSKQKAVKARVLTEIACLFCRRRHIKCGGPESSTTRLAKCKPCTDHDRECVFPERSYRGQKLPKNI